MTEDYVSFETAKLLKEKGFDDEYTSAFYDNRGILYFIDLLSDLSRHPDNDADIAASTLYVAMKWLREKYSLEIYSYHNNPTIYNSKWWFEIIEYPNSVAEYESGKDEEFDTYEQACEAAIKYCLENLI